MQMIAIWWSTSNRSISTTDSELDRNQVASSVSGQARIREVKPRTQKVIRYKEII